MPLLGDWKTQTSSCKEEIFYDESSETLAQVLQNSACPIPGNLQDHVGQGSEQPGQVKDVPTFCHWFGVI